MASFTERHKSAVTHYALQNNHVIDWKGLENRTGRWIKEAIAIRKERGYVKQE